MGIRDLSKFCQKQCPKAVRKVTLEDYAGKTLAIDINILIHQFCYNAGAKGKSPYIRGLFEVLISLMKNGINPIIVDDGKCIDAKMGTLLKRAGIRQDNKDKIMECMKSISLTINNSDDASTNQTDASANQIDLTDPSVKLDDILSCVELTDEQVEMVVKELSSINQHKKKIIQIPPNVRPDIIQLCKLMGVPYLRATYEADFLCAKLFEMGLIHGVISEDTDMLTHSVGILLRGMNGKEYRKEGTLMEYSLSKILLNLDLTMDQFIDLCVLCGCDYSERLSGVGPATSYRKIKKYGSMSVFLEKEPPKSQNSDFAPDIAREVFLTSRTHDSVIESSLKRHSADIEKLQDYLIEKCNYRKKTLETKIQFLEVGNM